ncbi:MAG: response regulator [Gammaproteobacteria bacterium]|nr:response regulator [Gammaproteobacteria bacterium]
MNDKPILLVEDNPDDRALTLRAFKKNSIDDKLHMVIDGQEALDYFFGENGIASRGSSELPKVILLDLQLPKVSGHEVLEKLRSDKRTQNIPIVMLTSSSEETDVLGSYQLGASSYIQKPVNYKKFIDVVSNLGLYWLDLNKTPQ